MRIRIALPLAEIMVVAAVIGLITIVACAWHVMSPGDGPPEVAARDLQVIGNRLHSRDGQHLADWVPAANGQPGHWKSVLHVSQQ